MWYGSYWTSRRSTTALGLTASLDGKTWHKHPSNPVFTPDPERPWESHYTTSHCVMRLPDDSLRLWYASRKTPPFPATSILRSTPPYGRNRRTFANERLVDCSLPIP